MLLLADPRRIRRIRSLGHSLHRLATAESSEKETLGFTPGASFFISFPHGKSLNGAFFFVASALTDLSSARLTTCALNTVRKQAFYNGSVVAVANCSENDTAMIWRKYLEIFALYLARLEVYLATTTNQTLKRTEHAERNCCHPAFNRY